MNTQHRCDAIKHIGLESWFLADPYRSSSTPADPRAQQTTPALLCIRKHVRASSRLRRIPLNSAHGRASCVKWWRAALYRLSGAAGFPGSSACCCSPSICQIRGLPGPAAMCRSLLGQARDSGACKSKVRDTGPLCRGRAPCVHVRMRGWC